MKFFDINIEQGMVLTTRNYTNFIVIPISNSIGFLNISNGEIILSIPTDIMCIRSKPINTNINSGNIIWDNNINSIEIPCIKCNEESFSIIEPILIDLGFKKSEHYTNLSSVFDVLIIDWDGQLGKYNFGTNCHIHAYSHRKLITNVNEFLTCVKKIIND